MGKKVTLDLDDAVYESLRLIAGDTDRSVEEVATDWLARSGPQLRAQGPADAAVDWQRLARHFGAVDSGDPRAGDNDRIDADLARECTSSSEDQS